MEINWSLIGRILAWTIPSTTLCVAIYSAILNRKAVQRHLLINLDKVDYSGSSGSEIIINIRNVGNVNVTINNIKLSDDFDFPINRLSKPYKFLPYELSGGSDCFSTVYINELAKTLIPNGHSGKIKFIAVITDGTGKTYKSKKSIVLNLDEYSKA